ncbi:hypothetical protein [Sulfurospirillum multivorans]|uniref:Signal transduction protein n=2 Tax=Sulfurospirillum multivorans TaxID=66821 RepID=A0AA86APX9_SULMK|nr:hypothetical protein [Sulfurospirillum multivorans]AHJ13627.1 putative signal transduction protein [Sulfurospirillum multivorans DSM 12446]QEH07117.1 putative signal transduction protein [Sulfurospirillum multivorans]
MAIFKKNIWLIFYVLALSAALFFLIISYFKWQNTYLKYQTSQENIVELMANATHSVFDTQERLMDILGVTIQTDQHYLNDPQGIEKHVSSLLQNPDVLAFGVTTPEGDFIYGSSHKDPTKIPNIAKQRDSHASFAEALSYETMFLDEPIFRQRFKNGRCRFVKRFVTNKDVLFL